ncbi:hypothetical protein LTR41_000374 [Exophiala xenobiotica]|nr:hypothetical protein LTR41_000374 [Exophiala xenobiotica]
MALPMAATKLTPTPTPTRQRQSLEPTPFIPSSSPLSEKSYCSGSGSPTRVVHTDSTKRYTFTPQRVKSLPRAWERRPATPYVPRNDAQKIWKRMPLGEVMTNFGEHWQQKGGAKGANTNGRSVKRLRVGSRQDQDEEEDKENIIEYVPSKWDDAAAVGSPKRKSVGVGFVAVNANAATLKPEKREPSGGSETDDGGVQEEDAGTSPPDSIVTVRQATEEEVCSPNRAEGSDLETEVAERSQDVSGSVKMPGQGEEKDQTFTLESDPEPSSSDATASEALLESALQQANTNPPEHEAGPASSTPQPTNQSTAIPADQDDTAYLHDFLSRARAQKAAKQQQTTSQEHETAAAPMDGIETTIATATSPESSAACHIEDVSVGESTSTSATAVSLSQDETPAPTPSLEQPDQEQTDTMMTSPRRSSRLITRIPLPRPQKSLAILPSNIALKRLNGTEFIAMQRETQSLALTTRANTKRNKGDAVGVQHKLVQLAAEERAGNGYGQGFTTEVPAKKGSKRKKKSKVVSWDSTLARYEDGEEVVVVSPDGEEAEPVEQEDEDERTPGQTEAERDGKENDDEQGREREKHENENQNGEKVPKELEEKNQVRKVRRLRKLNVGNVNGTPAPKRRISLGIPVPVSSSSSSSSTAERREDKENVDPSASEGGRQISGVEKRMQTRTRTSTSTSTRRA